MAGFVMPACSTARLKALKGLVIHVMATHTAPWIGRMRVLRKNPEPRPGMPGARILPLKGVGKRNAAAALGLVLQPPCPCTRQLLARRLGAKLSGNIKARSLEPLPSRDDRAVIEIQILDPQLQTLAIRMPVPYRSWANKRCSPSRKPRMRTTSSGVSTTGKRRDGRGLPIS